MRQGIFLFVVVLCGLYAGAVAAFEFKDLWLRADQQFENGDYQAARESFSLDQSDRGLYNTATTAALAGDHQQAIDTLEELLERNPEHADAKHNLDVLKQLQNQQQQDQGDDQQNESDQQQSGDEQSESGQQSEQQSEQDQSGGQSEGAENDSDEAQQSSGSDGELAADADDVAGSEDTEQDNAAGDADQTDGEENAATHGGEQTDQSPDDQEAEDQQPAMVPAEPSEETDENDQATEQWLRRIPDDPSQLLRNKIRLNHMIEHKDVQDMREPW